MQSSYGLGDRVDGLYDENTDDMWYPGRIQSIHDDPVTYQVLYDDGEVETHVQAAYLRPHIIGTICSGTRVLCRYNGGHEVYPGHILDVQDDGRFTVAYEDGEVEKNVSMEYITEVTDEPRAQEENKEEKDDETVEETHFETHEAVESEFQNKQDEETPQNDEKEHESTENEAFRLENEPLEGLYHMESLDLLIKRRTDASACKLALSTLVKQMRASPYETASLVHAANGEHLILDALTLHHSIAVIQCYGFVLLRRLCFLCEASTDEVLEKGLVESVSQSMTTFPHDAILQASACGALAVLARGRAGLTRLLANQVTKRVLAALRGHQVYSVHTRQVHYYACEVLLELCELQDRETLELLCMDTEEGENTSIIALLLLLVRQSLAFEDQKATCAVASLLLCLISRHPRAATLVLRLNGLPELSTVLARYPTEPSIQTYSGAASKQLALSVRHSPSKRVKETATELLATVETQARRSNKTSPSRRGVGAEKWTHKASSGATSLSPPRSGFQRGKHAFGYPVGDRGIKNVAFGREENKELESPKERALRLKTMRRLELFHAYGVHEIPENMHERPSKTKKRTQVKAKAPQPLKESLPSSTNVLSRSRKLENARNGPDSTLNRQKRGRDATSTSPQRLTIRGAKARQKRVETVAGAPTSDSLQEYVKQLFQEDQVVGPSGLKRSNGMTSHEKATMRERERLTFADKLHKMIEKAKSTLAPTSGAAATGTMASVTKRPGAAERKYGKPRTLVSTVTSPRGRKPVKPRALDAGRRPNHSSSYMVREIVEAVAISPVKASRDVHEVEYDEAVAVEMEVREASLSGGVVEIGGEAETENVVKETSEEVEAGVLGEQELNIPPLKVTELEDGEDMEKTREIGVAERETYEEFDATGAVEEDETSRDVEGEGIETFGLSSVVESKSGEALYDEGDDEFEEDEEGVEAASEASVEDVKGREEPDGSLQEEGLQAVEEDVSDDGGEKSGEILLESTPEAPSGSLDGQEVATGNDEEESERRELVDGETRQVVDAPRGESPDETEEMDADHLEEEEDKSELAAYDEEDFDEEVDGNEVEMEQDAAENEVVDVDAGTKDTTQVEAPSDEIGLVESEKNEDKTLESDTEVDVQVGASEDEDEGKTGQDVSYDEEAEMETGFERGAASASDENDQKLDQSGENRVVISSDEDLEHGPPHEDRVGGLLSFTDDLEVSVGRETPEIETREETNEEALDRPDDIEDEQVEKVMNVSDVRDEVDEDDSEGKRDEVMNESGDHEDEEEEAREGSVAYEDEYFDEEEQVKVQETEHGVEAEEKEEEEKEELDVGGDAGIGTVESTENVEIEAPKEQQEEEKEEEEEEEGEEGEEETSHEEAPSQAVDHYDDEKQEDGGKEDESVEDDRSSSTHQTSEVADDDGLLQGNDTRESNVPDEQADVAQEEAREDHDDSPEYDNDHVVVPTEEERGLDEEEENSTTETEEKNIGLKTEELDLTTESPEDDESVALDEDQVNRMPDESALTSQPEEAAESESTIVVPDDAEFPVLHAALPGDERAESEVGDQEHGSLSVDKADTKELVFVDAPENEETVEGKDQMYESTEEEPVAVEVMDDRHTTSVDTDEPKAIELGTFAEAHAALSSAVGHLGESDCPSVLADEASSTASCTDEGENAVQDAAVDDVNDDEADVDDVEENEAEEETTSPSESVPDDVTSSSAALFAAVTAGEVAPLLENHEVGSSTEEVEIERLEARSDDVETEERTAEEDAKDDAFEAHDRNDAVVKETAALVDELRELVAVRDSLTGDTAAEHQVPEESGGSVAPLEMEERPQAAPLQAIGAEKPFASEDEEDEGYNEVDGLVMAQVALPVSPLATIEAPSEYDEEYENDDFTEEDKATEAPSTNRDEDADDELYQDEYEDDETVVPALPLHAPVVKSEASTDEEVEDAAYGSDEYVD